MPENWLLITEDGNGAEYWLCPAHGREADKLGVDDEAQFWRWCEPTPDAACRDCGQMKWFTVLARLEGEYDDSIFITQAANEEQALARAEVRLRETQDEEDSDDEDNGFVLSHLLVSDTKPTVLEGAEL